MQCKDIPDTPILAFLAGPYEGWPVAGLATWFGAPSYQPPNSVLNAMPPETPEKLGLAKMRQMIRRRVVDGCPCGCRGDFVITAKGREELALAPIRSHFREAARLAQIAAEERERQWPADAAFLFGVSWPRTPVHDEASVNDGNHYPIVPAMTEDVSEG